MKLKNFVRDGRLTRFLEMGESGGIPVLFFHGFPGTSTQARIFQNHISSHNLHVVALERPGYGLSTPEFRGGFDSVSETALALVDSLGWTRFHVVGLSGGAPYARALSLHPSGRVLSCVCVAGLGTFNAAAMAHLTPTERWQLHLFRILPRTISRAIFRTVLKASSPKKILSLLIRQSSGADQQMLRDPEVQSVLLESFEVALCRGVEGLLTDLNNYVHFGSETIGDFRCPLILYHGDADQIVPIVMAEEVLRAHPSAELVVKISEGHYSLSILHSQSFADKLRELHVQSLA